jgi:hypothetical protein
MQDIDTTARLIVQTLIADGNGPGEGFTLGKLVSDLQRLPYALPAEDIERGLDCARAQHWIDDADAFVKLTQAGVGARRI